MVTCLKWFSGFRIHTIIVLLAGISPSALWSQTNQKTDWQEYNLQSRVHSFCETDYGYNGSIESIKSVAFDRAGRKIEEAEYHGANQNQLGQMWKRKTYSYDEKGRLIKETTYVYDKVIQMESKTFNALNQLVEEYSIPDESMRDGAAGVRNYRTTHRYDTKGNRIESRFTKNDNTIPYAVWTSRYNDKNDLVESRKTENGKTELAKFVLAYDARDSVIKKVEYRQSKPYQTWLYQYGADGKRTAEIEYENTSADSLKRPTKIKQYNAHGLMVKWVNLERNYRPNEPEFTSSLLAYSYDDMGRLIGTKSFKSDQLNSVATTRYEGEMTETIQMTGDGKMQDLTCTLAGRLTERTEFKDDGTFFRRTAFQYDGYGNQINEFYWGTDGQMVYRNGNYFLDYDSTGNWIQKNNNGRRTTVAVRREFQYYPD